MAASNVWTRVLGAEKSATLTRARRFRVCDSMSVRSAAAWALISAAARAAATSATDEYVTTVVARVAALAM